MVPCGLLVLCQLLTVSPDQYFKIQVVDDQTGRGVPLVEVQTTNNIRCYTDSNGYVAFHEPGLMDRKVFFNVKSHGYEYPKDGFGMAGTALEVKPGGSAVVKIKRINIAERLYRLTGGGIYRDTVLLGLKPPLREPVLNGQVLGCDSVLSTIYTGQLFWIWGDTNWPSYPLGNFHATGATSLLPDSGGLDPDVGVDFTYFVRENGFAKEMAPNPAPGPVWLDSLITFKDEQGKERLYAGYARVNTAMEAQERGLVIFNDQKQQFERIAQFDLKAPVRPGGHPFRLTVNGEDYIYFTHSLPLTRVRDNVRQFKDLSGYETYTCLATGSTSDSPKLDRSADGAPLYSWKRSTPATGPKEQADLIKAGSMKPGQALIQVRDADTGKPVQPHGSSVYWNEYRGRWVMIMSEIMGTSLLGEIWYLEADTPLGPWVYARKVVTHENYSFYNPKQHPYFAKDRFLYFEGTYTTWFTNNTYLTPRYDYNQMMYRLDLADPRLALPAPVYQLSQGPTRPHLGRWKDIKVGDRVPMIAFFAPDRPFPGSVAIHQQKAADGSVKLAVAQGSSASPDGAPLFHGLPGNTKTVPAGMVPMYEFVRGDTRLYPTTAEAPAEGYQRSDKPLCFVWPSPYAAAPPLPPKEDIKPAPSGS